MSNAAKKKPYEYPKAADPKGRAAVIPSTPARDGAARQEALRKVKMEAEQLKDKLNSSIMDNPKLAKKSAVLISLWIAGKQGKKK
jgi:hypothetical protein